MKKLLSIAVLLMGISSLSFVSAQCIKGDCYSGQGSYIYPSGAKYVGEFRNGKINGKGILFFSNGNKYIGEWKNHYREGYGRLLYSNGDEYEGNFKGSKFHGDGVISYTSGDEYDGNWVANAMQGIGIYSFNNGDRYEGYFKDNKFNGQGTMLYASGGKYVGKWRNNKKNGKGILYDRNGRKTEGNWANGKLSNRENTQTQSTASNSSSNSSGNSGNYSDLNKLRDCNKIYCKTGKGKFTYSDGSKYTGDFVNGSPQGRGTCIYSNGDKYVGGWKKHAPHGEGIMYYANGRVLGSRWTYGKPSGKLEADNEKIQNNEVIVDESDQVKIWAVVVGVARYTHMPMLKFTDDDAYQVYAFLKSPEGGALPDNQIRVLIDENATRKNIMENMRKVFLQADDNDVVIFYYSGHGYAGAFLPIDFDGHYNQLRHEDVTNILKESKAKHKLVLADACHSGSILAMKAPVAGTLKKYYSAFENTRGGTALFMSSKGEEFSLEDSGLRQGIFSHFLIRGLKGEADANKNKIVTISELYRFVFLKVNDYTNQIQTPTLSGDYDQNMPVSVMR